MKVALIITGRLETLTGGFIYDRFLVEALRRRGHRVELVGLPQASYGLSLAANLSRGLSRRLDGGGWDLLLQDELAHPRLLGVNRSLRAGPRRPIVGIVHQLLCLQPRRKWINAFYRVFEKRYLAGLDAFVFNSEATQRQARRLAGRERPQRVVRPAGNRLGAPAAADAIAARAERAGPLELLFVGNLSPVKGLEGLLRALALLPQAGWRLTVVGDTQMDRAYARRARRLVSRLGLSAAVAFSGRLEGGDLRAAFLRSHALAMPFAHEGFGIAALEAMGFGLPVIGSERGAVREFVRHGENGWLAAPGELAAVGRHIVAWMSDRRLLGRMGRAALATHRAWPTWEESMAQACLFLEELAG
ncbi:MAG: glycosyltransferase family 4 protein [Desulfobacterales bacterium]|jgi:glycosyltransferase involved in cell wall biosynthesis|nr:glycosyltransferase family 4 protein [Desulfobacterales bacterium]